MAKVELKSWRSEVDVPERPQRVAVEPMGLADYAAPIVVGVALIVAIIMTAYVLAPLVRPQVLGNLPIDWPALNSNIFSGIAFFWLELVAIVVGVQIFQDFRAKTRIKSKFRDVLITVEELIVGLDSARYKFAVALDESRTPAGSYATNLGVLNSYTVQMKDDFLREQFSDIRLTDHSRLLVDRVLRPMDRMTEETYDLFLRANLLNDRLLAAEASDGTEGETAPDAKTIEDLEALLGQLLDAVDPTIQGLVSLRNHVRVTFTALKLGKKPPSIGTVAR
jgi:hypothetical protein